MPIWNCWASRWKAELGVVANNGWMATQSIPVSNRLQAVAYQSLLLRDLGGNRLMKRHTPGWPVCTREFAPTI
jgi:hypothetical protein